MYTAEFLRKKSKKWWFHFPGQVYANDFVFDEPVNVLDAKAYVRRWLGVKRLSVGTECWPG